MGLPQKTHEQLKSYIIEKAISAEFGKNREYVKVFDNALYIKPDDFNRLQSYAWGVYYTAIRFNLLRSVLNWGDDDFSTWLLNKYTALQVLIDSELDEAGYAIDYMAKVTPSIEVELIEEIFNCS